MDFHPSWFGYDTAKGLDDEILIFGDRYRPVRSVIDDALDLSPGEEAARTSRVLGPALRRADEAYPHLWHLMSMTESERREAVGYRPYRDLLVANVLLGESARRVWEDPETAETMARTAEWIASPPWPAATDVAGTIQALACIYQGKARRRLGDAWRAELRLAAAFSVLQEIPLSDVHWSFGDELATLKEEQGRLDEAIALLWQAEALEVRFWSRRIAFTRLVRLGFLYLKQGDFASAMTVFTGVCARKERDALGVDLDLAVDLGRAVCLAAAGLAGPARQVLAKYLRSRRLLSDRDARLPLEWLECRIAVHLGDLERAIPRLEAVRRWLLNQFRFDEVCLCTLDLAFAYARRGDALERLPRLLAGVAGLPLAEQRPWATEALGRFREVLEREGGEPVAALREAAEIARRGEILQRAQNRGWVWRAPGHRLGLARFR